MGLFDPPEVADVCGQLGLSEDDPADREQVEMIRAFSSRPIPPREAVQAYLEAMPRDRPGRNRLEPNAASPDNGWRDRPLS